MATRDKIRTCSYDGTRPAPDAAYLEPSARPVARTADAGAAAAILNVIAGIWLIISPFVLGYTGGDATWNPIVFGAFVGILALARTVGGVRAVWLSWLNMAIGVWLFSAAFWLADSSQASWNVGILGVVVFVLGAWAATPAAYARGSREPA
jgi:SPW repeat